MPAGHIDSGSTDFAFGFKSTPKDTGLAFEERGLEKGCAMPVEVVAGAPEVRGEVVVDGSWWGMDVEKVRREINGGR